MLIQSELVNTKQNNLKTDQFLERIEELVAELNKVQIEEIGEESRLTIMRINDKFALNTLKQGINTNMRTLIFAAKPDSFLDAKELIIEAEVPPVIENDEN